MIKTQKLIPLKTGLTYRSNRNPFEVWKLRTKPTIFKKWFLESKPKYFEWFSPVLTKEWVRCPIGEPYGGEEYFKIKPKIAQNRRVKIASNPVS